MMMKELKSVSGTVLAMFAVLATCVLLNGCKSQPVFAEFSESAVGVPSEIYTKPPGETDRFHVGNVVTLNFSSSSGEMPLQTHQEAIKDDGRISPPIIGSVIAAGKSPGELQFELQTNYNRFYRNMTVTVTSPQRYYHVLGEVRSSGAKLYLGETDIVKAISDAGDFTEYARKNKIRLKRPNGKTEIIDYRRAVEGDSNYKVPVYPGDTIVVPRRLL
jgi:polysaccharide biosynthesis/export protein